VYKLGMVASIGNWNKKTTNKIVIMKTSRRKTISKVLSNKKSLMERYYPKTGLISHLSSQPRRIRKPTNAALMP
jgi:hypothetical protein